MKKEDPLLKSRKLREAYPLKTINRMINYLLENQKQLLKGDIAIARYLIDKENIPKTIQENKDLRLILDAICDALKARKREDKFLEVFPSHKKYLGYMFMKDFIEVLDTKL